MLKPLACAGNSLRRIPQCTNRSRERLARQSSGKSAGNRHCTRCVRSSSPAYGVSPIQALCGTGCASGSDITLHVSAIQHWQCECHAAHLTATLRLVAIFKNQCRTEGSQGGGSSRYSACLGRRVRVYWRSKKGDLWCAKDVLANRMARGKATIPLTITRGPHGPDPLVSK